VDNAGGQEMPVDFLTKEELAGIRALREPALIDEWDI